MRAPIDDLRAKLYIDRRAGKHQAMFNLDQFQQLVEEHNLYRTTLQHIANQLPTDPEWDAIGITEVIANIIDNLEDDWVARPNYTPEVQLP